MSEKNNEKFSIDDILNEYADKTVSKAKVDVDDILDEVNGNIATTRSDSSEAAEKTAEKPAAEDEAPKEKAHAEAKREKKASGNFDIRFDFTKGFDKQDMRTVREEPVKPQDEEKPKEEKAISQTLMGLSGVFSEIRGKTEKADKIEEIKADETPDEAPEPIVEQEPQPQEEIEEAEEETVLPENDEYPEADVNEDTEPQEIYEQDETEEEEEPVETDEPNEEEESDETDDFEEESIPYSRSKNHGSPFTMRTADDSDSSKSATAQSEYTKKEDADEIFRQIAKLKSTLTVRAAVLLFAAVFSLFITCANDFSLTLSAVFDRTVNPSAYLFTNTILGIVAVGFCYSVISLGIKNLFSGKADSDSIAAVNILAAILSGLVTLFDPESLKASFFHLYTSAAILGLLFNTLGKLSVVRRTQRNFEFVSSSDSFCALTLLSEEDASELTNSSRHRDAAVMKRTGFARDFMKNSYSSDISDSYARKTTPYVLIAALVVALLSIIFEKNSAGSKEKLFVFLATFSGTLTLASSFALTLIANSPLSRASKKLIDSAGVILGYSSVEEFADVGSAVVDAGYLFPIGTVEFVNLKMMSSTLIDDCIIYAASLAAAGKSVTQPAFYKMLRGKTELIEEVKNCANEDNLGISGWIKNKRVFLGSRELMESRAVDGLPSPDTEEAFAQDNEVMYLAISGRIAMMFSVSLSVGAAAQAQLQAMDDEGIDICVRSSDGFITRERLSELFAISVSRIKLIPARYDSDYERVTEREEAVSASMLCSGHLPSFAMLLVAAKRVKFSANLGAAIQLAAMILGIIICAVLMLMGSFSQITPTLAIVYNLAFLLLTQVMQNIRKL